jgi:hypothetical protein
MIAPVFKVNSSQDDTLNAINIELWGFKDCRLVKAMAIAKALQLLPAHQLEGLKEIRYEELALVPGLRRWIRARGRSTHRGRYDNDEQAIQIHRCSSRAQLFHTLFHEFGHFVYFRVLSSFEKKHWVREVFPAEPPVTAYGRRNAAEDFAEAFALYVGAPHRLSSCPGKLGYMRATVFREKSVNQKTMRQIIASDPLSDKDVALDTRI